jgi:hypothetical protein
VAPDGVLKNDVDVDGDAMTAVLVTPPANGVVTVNSDGSFVYTPDFRFTGVDTFTYRANDGQASSPIVTVAIHVRPFKPPPDLKEDVSPESPPELPAVEPPVSTDPDGSQSETATAPPPAGSGGTNPMPVERGVGSVPSNQQLGASADSRPAPRRIETPMTQQAPESLWSDKSRRDDGRIVKAVGTAIATNIYKIDPVLIVAGDALWRDLDALQDAMTLDSDLPSVVVGSIVTSSLGVSLGYVLWVLRSGYLLSSLLASMPAWRFVDPLPVLDYLEDDDEQDQDDESLETLIDNTDTERQGAAEPGIAG